MSADLYYTLMVLLTGVLVATASALLGTFLVLRRMALVSDAISHAILPGIALGFVATHSRHPLVMLVGAAIAALVTVWLVETLYRTRRVHEDTAIGVVFPALFAIGVILMDRYAHYVDLDLDCVLYGEIEFVPLEPLSETLAFLGPKAPWVLGTVTLMNLALVLFFYKELKLCTFDPPLGHALGFSPSLIHYLLMSAVAITTVAAFESVGAILVVAFLIVPAAAAYLLTDRLSLMLVLAVGLGVLSAVTGYLVAREEVLDCSVSGAMATMAGFWFVLVWLAAPRHGLLSTLLRRLRLRRQFAADLLLLHIQQTGALPEGDPRFQRSRNQALQTLQEEGLVATSGNAWSLTPRGETSVEELSRAYRA